MLKFTYPYNTVSLNNQSKILVDACFMLALQDIKHKENERCVLTSELISDTKSKLFVSNVVIAEVINRLVYALFLSDIGYRFAEYTLNEKNDIYKLISYFTTEEQNIIFSESREVFNRFRFSNHFDYIYKKSEDSRLLKVYYEEAVNIIDDLEEDLDITILPVNSNMVLLAKEMSSKYMLGINDAQHIAVALSHRMDYILTLDGDFEKVPIDKVKILKIEKEQELESTGTDD